MVVQRIVKPKTQKGKRFLEKRESKIFENTKSAMFIKGGNTSNTVTQILKELYSLKKPDCVMYKKKNIFRPFEDETPLEFFSQKSDASLFLFGCHSKKRPNNLILGRLFDFHVLDMVELGVEKFTSMFDIQGAKCSASTKPCIVFAGDAFDQEYEYKRLKNLFADFFRGPVVENIRLAGLEHVIMITAINGKIYIRNYRTVMKKSGSRVPRIELEDMGPSIDLSMRRTKLASDDLFKRSLKKPITSTPKKKKNVSQDPFGSKLGRIHMQKQDLDSLQLRKTKALKRRRSEAGKSADDDAPKKKKKTSEASKKTSEASMKTRAASKKTSAASDT